ncbi:MAG: pilus assembly protein, partial [Kiritimatiellaeota bacterium]|nr:pilus assembly protein [Kiritimatiellota bacterium]
MKRGARAGQAIAEFVVGMLALVILFMGMLQIEYLAHAHTKALNDARAQAGQDAMQTPYILRYNVPQWIGDWNNGRDNIIYSQDDTLQQGNAGAVIVGIVSHAHPSDLATYAPGNELSSASTTAQLLDGLMLTHGRERSPPVAMF